MNRVQSYKHPSSTCSTPVGRLCSLQHVHEARVPENSLVSFQFFVLDTSITHLKSVKSSKALSLRNLAS
jgi:hypothetical protein